MVGKRYREDLGDTSERLFLTLFFGGILLPLCYCGFSVCVFCSFSLFLSPFVSFFFVNVNLLKVDA